MALTLLSRVNKNTKLFDTGLGNGSRIYRCHAGNIHYPDSSQIWQDIDTTLLSKTGGKYQDKCFYSCEVPELSTGVFTWFNGDHFFSFKLKAPVSVGYTPTPDIWGTLGKGWRYPNCFGTGVHFEVYAKNSCMDHRIVWDQAPSNPTVDQLFDFEIVQFPIGINIRDINTTSGVDYDLTKAAKDAIEVTEKVIAIFDAANNGLYTSYISNPRAYNSDRMVSLPVRMIFYRAQGRGWFRKIVPKELFQNAVYPVFADHPTGYYSGSGDGRVTYSGVAIPWDTMHDATTGTTATDTIVSGGIYFIGGTLTRYLFRGFVPIDTSAIDDAATITDAVLNIYGYAKADDVNDSYAYLAIVQADKPDTATTALVVADFNNCGATNNPTQGHETSQRKDLTALSISAYTAWTLNSTGIGWISKTGTTKFGLRSGHDCQDVNIGDANVSYASFYSVERTGTSEDPYVEVTIVSAARTDRFFQMF